MGWTSQLLSETTGRSVRRGGLLGLLLRLLRGGCGGPTTLYGRPHVHVRWGQRLVGVQVVGVGPAQHTGADPRVGTPDPLVLGQPGLALPLLFLLAGAAAHA